MRTSTIYIIILFLFGIQPKLVAQDHFIKIIDIDSFPQVCQQIVNYGDNYLLGYYQTCTDLQSQCSGIIKIDKELKIKDQVILEKFSNNPNSIIVNQNELFYTGEKFLLSSDAREYLISSIDEGNLQQINVGSVFDEANIFSHMFQLNNAFWNDKLVLSGTGRPLNKNESHGLIYVLNQDYTLDTLIDLDFLRGNIIPWEMYVDAQNRLTVHLQTDNFDTNDYFTTILKFDTNYHIVWQWSSEELPNNRALPFGFEHKNGHTILNVPYDIFFNINVVRALRSDSTTAWSFKWPGELNGGLTKFINRLRPAKNGDILGVGRFSDLQGHTPPLSRVPFLFRLNEHGQLLWLKVYYKNQYYDNGNIVSGGFNDIVETDDGNLIAVGQIHNVLAFDPKVNGPRDDWDILIAKLGADGCIKPGCGEINVIDIDTEVNEVTSKISDIKCYPNPVKGESFTLEIPHDHLGSNFNVLVMDVMGKSVLHTKVDKGMNEIRIEHAGLYLVKVLENGNVVYTSKVVKI